MKVRQYSQAEIDAIILRIAKPIHKYFMRQINKEIFNKYGTDMTLEVFTSIVANVAANVDANIIRMVSAHNSAATRQPFSMMKLKDFYVECLENALTPQGKQIGLKND